MRWDKGGVIVVDLPYEMRAGHGMMGRVYIVCNGKGVVGIVGAAPGANVVGAGAGGDGEGVMSTTRGGVGTTGDIGSIVGTKNSTGGGGAHATGGGTRDAEYFWLRGISGGSEGA